MRQGRRSAELVPAVLGLALRLHTEEVAVDDLADGVGLDTSEIHDGVAHLEEHAHHAGEARGGEAEVVGQAVPEGLRVGWVGVRWLSPHLSNLKANKPRY